MKRKSKIEDASLPTLLVFLFAGDAVLAHRAASPRLLLWCQAFESWLDELRQRYKPEVAANALRVWRLLLSEHRQMPWEFETSDFEQHAAQMAAWGYSANTIYITLGILAGFYRWCDERQVDPQCPPGFNPAAAAPRPKIERYAGAALWSVEELEKLLGLLRQDETPLGKRDYAFFLARLRLGVPLNSLLELRWGQIEARQQEVTLRWRVDDEPVELPAEVWSAILAWLAAGGRLEGMAEHSYVFAPLAHVTYLTACAQARAWTEERPLSRRTILKNLRSYGRQVGIAPQKLTLRALQRTAVRLRLDAGASVAEIQLFMDIREAEKSTAYRLRRLPQLPHGSQPAPAGEPQDHAALPATPPRPPRSRGNLSHGLFARSQPLQEVLDVLAENIQGIEEEVAGMRALERGLMALCASARSSQETVQLMDAYTLTAGRLAGMLETEKQLQRTGEADAHVDGMLDFFISAREEKGEKVTREQLIAEILSDQGELVLGSRRLEEEIAGVRLVLRNTLKLASQAGEKGEIARYIRLVEIYSLGCNRLLRLLKAGQENQGRLAACIRDIVAAAMEEVSQEWQLPG